MGARFDGKGAMGDPIMYYSESCHCESVLAMPLSNSKSMAAYLGRDDVVFRVRILIAFMVERERWLIFVMKAARKLAGFFRKRYASNESLECSFCSKVNHDVSRGTTGIYDRGIYDVGPYSICSLFLLWYTKNI